MFRRPLLSPKSSVGNI